MDFKTKAIVLHHLRYSDTSLVATIYTQTHGRKSFLIHGVYRRKSKFPPTFFQPLTFLDLEISVSPRRDLQHIKEASIYQPVHSFSDSPVKGAVTLFLAEILYKTLREEEPNHSMFEFLENAIQYLDATNQGAANFHLWFMINLTKYLGFYPVNNYSAKNTIFDLVNGRFYTPVFSKSQAKEQELAFRINQLLELAPEHIANLELNHETRNFIIENLIEYYHIHHGHLGTIKSLPVLQGVFGE
jgi:DNA repair protein RecO (recombination protein O)